MNPVLLDRIARAIDDYSPRIIPPEHKAPLRDLIAINVDVLIAGWERDFDTLAKKVGGILGAEKLIRDRTALLEALEMLLLNNELGEYESQRQGKPRMIEARGMARAAIAQAKGENIPKK